MAINFSFRVISPTFAVMTGELYREFGPWLTEKAGCKVQKISVNAGFTCPNRDGSLGVGGCTYCNNRTFNPEYCDTGKSVTQQLAEGKSFFAKKYPEMKYLAYFQAYTNTYGKVENVIRLYEEALSVSDVVGLVVATRPDCVSPEMLSYLSDLSRRCLLIVEYGIESTDDAVLKRINRGHDFQCTVDAVNRTHDVGILTGGHIILGLPGKPMHDVLDEAKVISSLPLDTLKIHQLQLIKGTVMADEYASDPSDFNMMTADEYIDFVIDYIERLRPDLVLERFVSQSPASLLATKGWGLKNYQFVERLRHRMIERGARQGRLYD